MKAILTLIIRRLVKIDSKKLLYLVQCNNPVGTGLTSLATGHGSSKKKPPSFILSLHVAVKVILHACSQKSCAPCSQLAVEMLPLLSRGNILIITAFQQVPD